MSSYYTYAPGSPRIPKAYKGPQLTLAPGQKLGFAQGKGYYGYTPAAPKVPPVKPFDYHQGILGEGIGAEERGQNLAKAQSGIIERDNAVKALNFAFKGPDNPYSFTNEANRNLRTARAQMIAQRAARGVRESGGTTLQQEDIAHDYGKTMYDQGNVVSGQIGTLDANLAGTLKDLGYADAKSVADAADRLANAGIGGPPVAGQGIPGYGASAGGAPGGVAPAPGGGGTGAFVPGTGTPATQAYKDAMWASLTGQATPEQSQIFHQGVGADSSYGDYQKRLEAANAADRAQNPQNWIKAPDGSWWDMRGTTPEVRRQAVLNAQGYGAYGAGGPEETYRRLQPGQQYTWQMHLADLVKKRGYR